MSIPKIETAIPKRRYQYGEFVITVLSDIQSGDEHDYRWIFAVATESDPEPKLFLSSERADDSAEGSHLMRVSMPDGTRVLGQDDRWSDLDAFVDACLDIVKTMLNLSDELPHRLL